MHIVSSDIDGTQIPAKSLKIQTDHPAYPASWVLKREAEALQAQRELLWTHNSGRSLQHILQDVQPTTNNPNPILTKPDAIIANVGTEIYLMNKGVPTPLESWRDHLAAQFAPKLREQMAEAFSAQFGKRQDAVVFQPEGHQGPFKLSFTLKGENTEATAKEMDKLFGQFPGVRTTFSAGWAYDVTPERATKGLAMAHLADHLKVPHGKVIVAGDTENDLQMYLPQFRGIVVGNARPGLIEPLKARQGQGEPIIFAQGQIAQGVLEGLKAHGLPVLLPEAPGARGRPGVRHESRL